MQRPEALEKTDFLHHALKSSSTGARRMVLFWMKAKRDLSTVLAGAMVWSVSIGLQAQVPVRSEAPLPVTDTAADASVVRLKMTPVNLAQMLALRSLELAYGRESVTVAGLLAQAEQALYEPVLFLTTRKADTLRQRTVEEQTSSFTSAGESVLNEESRTMEVGVRQRVPTGGELSVSARQFQRSSNILAKANTDLELNSGLVLTFKQPLARGMGRGITETDRRVAEIEAVVTQWQFYQQLQKVVAEGLSLFWQAQVATQALGLREELQRTAQTMLADAQERFAAGRLAPRMVNEAQRMLVQRQAEVLRAKQNRDELLFRLLSSVDLPHQRIQEVELLAADVASPLSSLPVSDSQALSQWAPYRIAELRQAQGQVRLLYAQNQKRPVVDLVLSHTQTGLSDTRRSWSVARSGRYPEWYVGLSAELGAFGNDRARAQAQAQERRVAQSETEQRAIEQTFLNDLQAKREAMAAVEKEFSMVQSDLAVRAQFFEQEKLRVALGMATLFNRIQAEQDVLEAKIRLADVSGRRETARLSLQLAEGQLLQVHAVETPLPSEP